MSTLTVLFQRRPTATSACTHTWRSLFCSFSFSSAWFRWRSPSTCAWEPVNTVRRCLHFRRPERRAGISELRRLLITVAPAPLRRPAGPPNTQPYTIRARRRRNQPSLHIPADCQGLTSSSRPPPVPRRSILGVYETFHYAIRFLFLTNVPSCANSYLALSQLSFPNSTIKFSFIYWPFEWFGLQLYQCFT